MRPTAVSKIMKKIVFPLLLALAFIAVAVVGTLSNRPAEAQAITCADPVKGCTFSHRGLPATLRFSRQPMPLQTFRLDVLAPGAQRTSVELQMEGMGMGFNHYDLHAAAPGMVGADITLSMCVSGRRDWKLFLDIDGQRYVMAFSSAPHA
jgi:hypothetical protein